MYARNDMGSSPPRARGQSASPVRAPHPQSGATRRSRAARRVGLADAQLGAHRQAPSPPRQRGAAPALRAPRRRRMPPPAAAISGMSSGNGGSRGTTNSVCRAPGIAAAIASKCVASKWKARQRSPVPCSWPHSKHAPSLPRSTAPGASTAEPCVDRYWNAALRYRSDARSMVLLCERPVARAGVACHVADAPTRTRCQNA